MPRQIRLCAHPKLRRYAPLKGWRRFLPFFVPRRVLAVHDARNSTVWTNPINMQVVAETLRSNGYEVQVITYLERVK